jgi:hypothetical protein
MAVYGRAAGLIALTAVASLACGGSGAPPGPSPAGLLSSPHFLIHYPAADAASVGAMAAALEREYARILGDLGAGTMPVVNVTLYADHSAMAGAVRPVAGEIPSFASGLVTSATQIHVMSPSAPGWGPVERVSSALVHEFAHCVSLHLNLRIANNPRWLWETVAIYESRQSVDLRTLGYMTAGRPPSLEELNAIDNPRIYDVGYSIGEFIVARWGQRAIGELIAANGDTAAVLGVSPGDFHRDWFAFVKERYRL